MHHRASKLAVIASALALLFAVALPASAQTVSSIRVRLHPYMAAAGTLPPGALAKLEALVGTGLTLTGTTRTGALDLSMAQPQDSTAIAATLKALRNDRGVLWAETPRVVSASLKSAQVLPPGAAANPFPAKVINLSLGGFGACDQSIQESIDDALAQGAVVVASAGNSSANVETFTPANCSGVISVAAHAQNASLASYSNFGPRIDVSAPGGDLPVSGLIISTSNSGKTVPEDPDYVAGEGTSFASPLVSGTAAMMLARNPMLTAGRVLDIITGTARDFPIDSVCSQANFCGAGMLDSGAAVSSTVPGGSTPPLGAFQVVEYYNAYLDHYFITAQPAEIAYIDTVLSGSFQRTGLYFYAYLSPFTAPPGSRPVCRFFATGLINSHFFTASASECNFVLTHWPGTWFLETPASFYIQVPDSRGDCPDGTLPVYRFFNNRNDANHRYTVDLSVRRAMLNRSWVPEGNGPNAVAFCSVF